MTLSDRDVRRQRKQHEQQFEPNHPDPWGEIVTVNGSVNPPGRINWVWVSMYGLNHSVVPVLNETMLQKAGTAVQLGPDPKPPGLKVIGPYTKALPPNSTVDLGRFNTPPHAESHQYLSETLIGDDPVKVYQPALQMLKTTGNGTNLIVSTQAYGPFPGADTDMTADIPATAGHVRRVLIYYDRAQNKMATIQGAAVLDNSVMPVPYPEAPENATESAYIRLANGQTAISTVNHVEDARDFLASGSDLALEDLIDVTLTTPADGEVLTYDEENNIWINLPSGAGVSDVDDLTTVTGNSGEMVRVAAAGGLEYRTPTQVLTDIGALAIANNLSDVDNASTARDNITALGWIEGSVHNGIARWSGVGGNQLNYTSVLIDDSDNMTIPGTLSLGTDLAIADGGTGASDEGGARTNLGLVAGGTGDIWVEKAGDTMTGALIINAASPQLELQGASQQLNFGTTGANGHINGASSALTIHGSAGIEFTANSGDYFWTISTTQLMQGTTTEVTFNPNQESTLDFRVAGENNANMIVVDSSADRLGIGIAPSFPLHVSTSANAPQLYLTSTGTSTRAGINHASNTGFGLYIGGALKFSNAVFQAGSGNLDFAIWNDQLGAGAIVIDGDNNNIGLGTTTPAASAKLDITSTTGALLVSRMTTTQRDALTAVNGMIIYNSTTNTMQGRVNGAWANL